MAYDDLKGEILDKFSKKYSKKHSIKHSMTFTGSLARARFESKNGNGVRLVVSVSKRHNLPSGLYWYGFSQSQIDFLDEATKKGYFIMVFSDSKRKFKIPHKEMKQMAKEMNSTGDGSQKNYQVIVKLFEGREVIYASRTGSKFEFLQYEF